MSASLESRHARRQGALASDATLGPVQRHVLLVLANRGECTCTDWGAWYPLRTEQIYGAMLGLGRRGYVEPTGFDGRARLYGITREGAEVADRISSRWDL